VSTLGPGIVARPVSAVIIVALLGSAAADAARQEQRVTTVVGYLKASNPGEDDHLGAGDALTGVTLAVSGDGATVAVGAPKEDGAAPGITAIKRSDGRSSQSTYIRAPDADEYDLVGAGVALSGDGRTLAAGAMGEHSAASGVNGNQADTSLRDSGAVYVHER
jgi:hypothetical protein